MKPHSYLNPKTEIRSSPIRGKGIFAKRLIKKDEIIILGGGQIITEREYNNLQRKKGFKKNLRNYTLGIAKDFYLATLKREECQAEDFINHSCNPNAGMKGQILWVAMRDIRPGEEMTYDYAMTDSDPDDYFQCHCGTKNCRKVITGQDWKNPTLQRKYKGYFSWYIEEKIKKLKKKLKSH